MIAPLLLLSRKLPSFCHLAHGLGQNFEVVILFSLL